MTLRVMIVDDTVTYRSILKETLSKASMVEVVATARHGEDALAKLNTQPVDLVLLDVEMPIMDGLTTLKEIKRLYPKISVVMVSGVDPNSANITINALEAGALDFVTKPDFGSMAKNIQHLRNTIIPITEHLNSKINKSLPSQATLTKNNHTVEQKEKSFSPKSSSSLRAVAPPPKRPRGLHSSRFSPQILCIGVSTGGPSALKQVIPKLSAHLNMPVVVVIHMPEVFTRYLAESLNRESALQVKEAEHLEVLENNTVYIAPGGRHLVFEKSQELGLHCIVNSDPPENSCRPAVDVMFRSVAHHYKSGALAIIMTGMGSDGLKGVSALCQSSDGHHVMTQSESSCTVYGMPKAIDDAGLSDESIELNKIAERITQLSSKERIHF